jgi:S1-C subfamily serine protease
MVKRAVTDLDTIGRVRRARIGLVTRDVRDEGGQAAGLEVTWVLPFGPAEVAGLRRGDRIVGANGELPRTTKRLKDLVLALGIGDRLDLDVMRGADTERVTVTVAAADEVGLGAPEQPTGALMWAGASVEESSEAISDELGVSPHRGLIVRSVGAGSWAARLGVMAGDRILKVGDRKVDSLVELTGVLADKERGFVTVGVARATGALLLILPVGSTARSTQ